MTAPSQPACSCGQPFTRQAVLAGRTVGYWCPACDEHGSGCQDRTHPSDRPCRYAA